MLQGHSQKFPKCERLCSKKLIGELFKKGSVKKFPDIRMHFLSIPREESEFHQVLFSIPRKLHKKAATRNRIRRRLRESYRKNKPVLYANPLRSFSYLLAYVYISGHVSLQKVLEEQVIASLEYLLKKEKSL